MICLLCRILVTCSAMLWTTALLVFCVVADVAFCMPTNSSNATQTKEQNCSNTTEKINFNCINTELKSGKSSLLQMFAVTLVSGIWLIYITFFNSRLVGLLVTKTANQFSKDAYVSIGSISISLLAGKVMFREVVYINVDYSIRLKDGYIIFRWWRPYNFTKWIKQKELDQGHTRLSVYISHLEYHLYNRSNEYNRLKDLFGANPDPETAPDIDNKPPQLNKPAPWRSLFPVIKFTISSGKIIFGNRLLPYSLIASFEDGDLQYKTTEPSNLNDLFMHIIEGNLSQLEISLTPSIDFDPSVTPAMLRITKVHNEPPPRTMRNAFTVARSHNVQINYSWDEPGLVPPEVKSRDSASLTESPLWKMQVSCGKRTNLYYGPWADRQRELLWKFFFPPDYQKLKVNHPPEPGDLRTVDSFCFSLNFLDEANLELLFTNQEIVSTLQTNVSKGSCMEVEIPMTIYPDGYTTKIKGRLLHTVCSSSLSYEHLLNAEIIDFNVTSSYPLHWNDVQHWSCELNTTKATCFLLFQHKDFFSNFMDDWADKVPSDLMRFVPYTFDFNIKMSELEVILPTNAYNWIDCSIRSDENALVGLYGKQLQIEFQLPFVDFLPPTWKIPFNFDLDKGELCLFLPKSNPARNLLLNLKSKMSDWKNDNLLNVSKAEKIKRIEKKVVPDLNGNLGKSKQWGTINNEDWVKCWQVPALQLTLTYTWFPIYPSFVPPSSDVHTTNVTDSNETLLGKTALPKHRGVKFDPTTLDPDEIRIDLNMEPGSTLFLYGSLLDLLLIIKENYFGYDDHYTVLTQSNNSVKKSDSSTKEPETVVHENPLYYRPLQVTLDIQLNEITGVLPIYPTPVLSSPPTVKLKKLIFEMDKNHPQTRLQLLLSELDIAVSDRLNRADDLGLSLNDGHVHLHDLQLRGHAMFSGNGLPLGATQIEYAWLTEILIGQIEGKLSIPQTQALLGWGQLFVYLFKNEEHQLITAFPDRLLPTGIAWDYRKKNGKPAEELDVKYLMMRIKLDGVHLQLLEATTLLDLELAPVTLANGNVQERGVTEAVSIVAESIKLKQRIVKRSDEWLDGGEVDLGPLIAQITMATDDYKLNDLQEDFLKFHDRKTRRLDFLWESNKESVNHRTSTGMASLLDNVRNMKSWGCTFFTPLCTTHPTFFYNRHPDKMPAHKTQFVSTSEDLVDGSPKDTDEEDVFDSGMDFGMSLLIPGNKLLSRRLLKKERKSNSERTLESEGVKQHRSTLLREKLNTSKQDLDKPSRKLTAGELLMSAGTKRPHAPSIGSIKQFSLESHLKRSTESNLYCSAESIFKSTSSFSSEAYFSAESDVENEEDLEKKRVSTSSSSVQGSTEEVTLPNPPATVQNLSLNLPAQDVGTDGKLVLRPDNLAITNEINAASKNRLKTPKRKCSVRKQTLGTSYELLACYEKILTSSKMKKRDESECPDFVGTCQGMHPSVVLKKSAIDASLNRRYSMDILNQTEEETCNSTNITLHAKDAVKIQISPFLLESLHQFVAAAEVIATWRHPLDVIAELQSSCVDNAVTSYKVQTSVEEEDAKKTSEADSEVKPGFQIHLCVDAICVNMVQATLGDDPVFNLHINKLLPNPALSLLTCRLDQVDLHLELNSKHNKLLSKMLTKQRKISSMSNKSSDQKIPAGIEKAQIDSTSEPDEIAVYDFVGRASVASASMQLRVLSEDGNLPERTSMIAISDENSRSSIRLDETCLLPAVVEALARYEELPEAKKRRTPPPKSWGWVTVEAGCKMVSASVVKQVPSYSEESSQGDAEESRSTGEQTPSPNQETHRVRFEEQGLLNEEPSNSFGDHVTNGVLNVDLVWLNIVSPFSTSQSLKSSRSCRSWNLLTSVAPSVSAWLDPLDRFSCSLERYEKAAQTRKYAAVSAPLLMALEATSKDSDLVRKLWNTRRQKFEATTDASKAIRKDPSYRLCDALQLFLHDRNEVFALEASLDDPPALVSMEKGFHVVIAQWNKLVESSDSDSTGKSRKKSSSHDGNRSYRPPSGGGIKFDGNLDLNMILEQKLSVKNKSNESGKQPLLSPEIRNKSGTNDRQAQSTVTRSVAQEVVYKQQQSMYSWMQNHDDVEANKESPTAHERIDEAPATSSALFTFKPADLTPHGVAATQEKFKNFFRFFGPSQVSEKEDESNFVKSHCSGSLYLRAHLKTLRIDKQIPDKLYLKQPSHKNPKTNRKSWHDANLPEAPILLFQGFTFNCSILDQVIKEKKEPPSEEKDGGKALSNGKNANKSNNKSGLLFDPPAWKTSSKNTSRLNLRIDSSLKQVTQRVDIALVRLVHQFVQCSDAIQQAKTDILVNKYTEGAGSPDPTSLHKRTLSGFTNLSSQSFSEQRPPLHRRNFSQTSAASRFHSNFSDSSSLSSSSSDSEALCWKIFYRLIDPGNSSSGLVMTAVSITEEFESESGRTRGFSSIVRHTAASYESPFVSMVIAASFKVKKIQFLAEFGDLKCSVEARDLGLSVTHTQTSTGLYTKFAESVLKARLAKIEGEINESLSNVKKTVCTCDVASCYLDASTNHMRDSHDGNTCAFVIGLILIDLPQHPASLHDVVSRGTQNLSSHILEFSKTPTYKYSSFDVVDGLPPETPSAATLPPTTPITPLAAIIDLSQDSSEVNDLPVVVSVDGKLEGIKATVNLLPSLRVTYNTRSIEGQGRSGPDAEFSISLSEHAIHFVSELNEDTETDAMSTKISFPTIEGSGKQMNHERSQTDITGNDDNLRAGSYLLINVNIGSFDHTLTTDLFNQLVFFHQVFMDEINDVITKMSRGKPVLPVRSETSLQSSDSDQSQIFLYQLQVELEEIRLTASTPSGSAVRLRTGKIVFELSNRILGATKGKKLKNLSKYLKMFGKAQVDLNLALGTLHCNNVYPEAESEFHQMAYFTTKLGLQNTSQHGVPTSSGLSPPSKNSKNQPIQDNNVVLISLDRPIIFLQPTAFDKAILIFLAYKHAYEEWTEERERKHGVRRTARNIVSTIQRNKTASMTGSLFLQLSVNDLGLCLPTVNDVSKYTLSTQDELSSALVLTVQNTLVTACYDRSLVTRGHFKGFCVRFADDFQTSWDDWSPQLTQVNVAPGTRSHVIMNSFVVPDGTYEVCSDTTTQQAQGGGVSALTRAHVRWQMKGIDVELDTKIGAYLAGLVDAVTLIAGQDADLSRDSNASDKLHLGSRSDSFADLDVTSQDDVVDAPSRDKLSPLNDESPRSRALSYKEKTKKLEQELNEQVRIVNDLRSLGAKPTLIQEQERQLVALESTLSSMFRQTVRNKLRRSSTKNVDSLKKPTHQRSMSHGVNREVFPSPKPVRSAFATLPPGTGRDRAYGMSFTHNEVFLSGLDLTAPDTERTDNLSESGSDGDDEVDYGPRVRRSLYNDKDSLDTSSHGKTSLSIQGTGAGLEAELELALDVRVEIDGGKIVCHPKTSPDQNPVTDRSKGMFGHKMEVNKTTTFFVPGVDIKIHYNSHQMAVDGVVLQEFFTPPGSPKNSRVIPEIAIVTPGGGMHSEGPPAPSLPPQSKRACVYACFSLQSLPEMIISPYLLDFLEQTLSVIPTPKAPLLAKDMSQYSDDEDAGAESSSEEGPGAVEVFNSTMASLPVDVVVSIHIQPSKVLFNCQPTSKVECLLHIPSLEVIFSSIRDTASPDLSFAFPDKELPSGMSFSAVMSDFSVYVFHPYGAQQGLDAFDLSNKQGSGRKDSLSVNLQLVKVNIVRTRKGSSPVAADPLVGGHAEPTKLLVNISVLVDIDKASFKYDMRRLSEILAFPRAWYRKSIARRLFFGDTNQDPLSERSEATGSLRKGDKLNRHDSHLNPRRPTLTPKSSFHSSRSESKTEASASSKPGVKWRGVVLFNVRMSRFDVDMNMGNVMGVTLWSSHSLTSDGKLCFHSSGEKEIHLACGLERSKLTAKSGIIGGDIELRQLQASCNLFDTDACEPKHNVCVKMQALDGRIEYMGSCIMMGRLTSVCLKLGDEWKMDRNKSSVSVFVPGDVGWKDFYLIISRSTTPDVIKMLSKLEEFFTQQFHNSVRALTSLRYTSHSDVTFRKQATAQVVAFAHHRHWPPAYAAISQSQQGGATQYNLGGSLCLHGNELTVVCFHGANFHSHSWVLFNLLQPNIVFSTEAQEIKESMDGNETSTLAIQSLTFNLSHDYWLKTGGPTSDPMATVSRVTRRQQNPPPNAAPLDEWFAYVTASRSQELNMLRTLNDLGSGGGSGPADSSRNRRVSGNSQQSNYNHGTEIIFALPKLQLDFKTEHIQGPRVPDSTDDGNRPLVECSFVTEFTDHICVTMDVELIMFLHDLISSYLKEKQQAFSSRSRLSSIGAHSGAHNEGASTPFDPVDFRNFVCNTWQLEPTVRLISWAGRRIEPVGVDYILQKLGFRHARTTIPKWMQRGVLDILDQTLAVIVQNLVVQINSQKYKK